MYAPVVVRESAPIEQRLLAASPLGTIMHTQNDTVLESNCHTNKLLGRVVCIINELRTSMFPGYRLVSKLRKSI